MNIIRKIYQKSYKYIYTKDNQGSKREGIQTLYIYRTLQYDIRFCTKFKTRKGFKYNV